MTKKCKKIQKLKSASVIIMIMTMLVSSLLTGCGPKAESRADGPDFDSLDKTGSMELKYAEQFTIDEYGQYKLITINDEGKFILVPEDADTPSNLPEDVTVLKQPLDKTYLVSSSTADLIRQLGALSDIRLMGFNTDELYIEEVADTLKNGDSIYAGKYSAPDYELLTSEGCNFAIENTMIYHNPDVKEKIEELGIPVLVDRSSYESHPLGRLEWIKLYGAIFGKSDVAESFYDDQLARISPIMEKEKTGLTVAFFYVTSDGAINVRKTNDYISKMIELAGGTYVLTDLPGEDENSLSTIKMNVEEFYTQARDADVIIYNSIVDGELSSVQDLIDKNIIFKDFKAVKEGRVYCTGQNFFQESTGACDFIEDVNKALEDSSASDFRFLKKVD